LDHALFHDWCGNLRDRQNHRWRDGRFPKINLEQSRFLGTRSSNTHDPFLASHDFSGLAVIRLCCDQPDLRENIEYDRESSCKKMIFVAMRSLKDRMK